MNKRRFFYLLLMILLLIVVATGWFVTDHLVREARQQIIRESQASVLTLTIHLSSTFNNLKGAVKSLAGSPWIAPALMSKRERDMEQANSALARYNSALNATVSYLMDADGLTVASSNRNNPDSFVGKSYRFRPYFQDAAKGHPGRYFAIGVTSGKRGFYASYPVQNRLGKVLGVVTMKKNLDEMEIFFSKYPFCFFINPDGVIFLSSSPAMVLKRLWPVGKAAQKKLIASQEFGYNLPETFFLKKEIVDGTEVNLAGKDYFVSRKVIDSDGWSIVLLTPTDRIGTYRLIGILATISVSVLIMVFSSIIYVRNRSREVIRQGEEGKRLLLQATGEGIFGLDSKGQVTFVNPAALRILGFAEEEMLGQKVHNLIHYSHKDGSNYPVEDCPMNTSYAKGIENRVTDEFLWRKDGICFPVEYSSMPILRGSQVTGVVVTFWDITERKRVEEALINSETRLHTLIQTIPDIIWLKDKDGVYLSCNSMFERFFGAREADIVGKTDYDFVDRELADAFCGHDREAMAAGKPISKEDWITFADDGHHALMEAIKTPMYDARGTLIGVLGIGRDITERKRIEDALRESEARYRAVTYSATDAIITTDSAGTIIDWNRGAEKIFGYIESEIIGQPVIRLLPSRYRDRHLAGLIRVQADEEPRVIGKTVELEGLRKDLSEFPIELSLADWKTGGGQFYTAILRDITERKQNQKYVEYLAVHDSLTGLLNRHSLEDILNRIVAKAKRGTMSSLLYMDLDNFKEVNDTVGHGAGDEVLIILTDLIKTELRTEDIVFRLGGDEFAVLLEGMTGREALSAAERLRLVVEAHPFALSNRVFSLSLSLGLIQIDGTLASGELLSQADAAMYRAKALGKNRIEQA